MAKKLSFARLFKHRSLKPEARRLLAWLLFWVVLPNFGFSVLWLIGSPPRYPDIIAIGTIGLMVRKQGATIKFLSLLALIAYTTVMFICRLFDMGPTFLFQAFQFLGELNPAASVEYLVVIAVLIITLLVAAWVCRRPMNFTTTRSLMIAVCAVGLVASADLAISAGSRGSYTHEAPTGTKFESGVTLSHFADRRAQHRNLLLVTVEAMGVPRDPLIASRLFASFDRPDVRARYDITRGRTRYFGTTTNAEVRELCGIWGNYPALLVHANRDCLPATLSRIGYRTTAIHGFESDFFERQLWYPNVGFRHMLFRKDLLRQGAGKCGGVFEGACDRDVPAIIARLLKAGRSPQFIYWLTLNSHLPVPSSASLHTDRCAVFAPELATKRPMACRMLLLWEESFSALAHEMTQADFPETDVLIVGDHMPPFFSRKQRSAFEKREVPWILFRAKPKSEIPTR